MNFFDVNSEADNLSAEEERILASFTRRLIEIPAVAGARGSATSPTAALNAMRLPAIALSATEPIIVQRQDKLPVLVRTWRFDWAAQRSAPEMNALLTLNALGPKPGPPPAILAKTFRLTPAEAKLACVIARGASPEIAAGELKISRETARNQLKSVFAKPDTHRQSELVALLLQVE